MSYFGYGVDLSTVKNIHGLEIIKESEDLYSEFKEFLIENGLNESEEALFEWADFYENIGYSGLAPLITTIINENEGLDLCCDDSVVNGIIYCPALFPWQYENENMKNLTEEELCRILT